MKDHSDNSSNTIQSDSLRVATTRLGSTTNTQSSTSKSLNECIADPTVPTADNSSSVVYTRPDNTSIVFPFTMTVTRKGLLSSSTLRISRTLQRKRSCFLLNSISICRPKANTTLNRLTGPGRYVRLPAVLRIVPGARRAVHAALAQVSSRYSPTLEVGSATPTVGLLLRGMMGSMTEEMIVGGSYGHK